jgi:hypothetical protein
MQIPTAALEPHLAGKGLTEGTKLVHDLLLTYRLLNPA